MRVFASLVCCTYLAGSVAAQPAPSPVPEPADAGPDATETPTPGFAVDDGDDGDDGDDFEESLFTGKIYGYIDAFAEKVARTPSSVNAAGETVKERNPHEFDVANLKLMAQGAISNRFRYYLVVAADGSGSALEDLQVTLRNAWVDAPLYRDLLVVRAGKLYRRFGLYNEILDAVPTFIGIEPPEMFDGDHLLLTRTTNLMIHGRIATDQAVLSYAFSTGNDERADDEIPLGLDLRVDIDDTLLIGGSFYITNGDATPSAAVGDGPPLGGVANWMTRDEYNVVAVFAKLTLGSFLVEGEFTTARHQGTRDPDQVLQLLDAGLNERQLERFGLAGDDPVAGDVLTDADYTVITAYVRTGLRLAVGNWSLTPYAQLDYYKNPETIQQKDFGGDNEAGLADDGEFFKTTVGLIARPVDSVALKVDGSVHTQTFNDEMISYPEVRTSLSIYWELFGG